MLCADMPRRERSRWGRVSLRLGGGDDKRDAGFVPDQAKCVLVDDCGG